MQRKSHKNRDFDKNSEKNVYRVMTSNRYVEKERGKERGREAQQEWSLLDSVVSVNLK